METTLGTDLEVDGRESPIVQPLIIVGTGGNAYDVLDVVEAINACLPTWRVVGFLDDARPVGSRHLTREILGGLRDARRIAAEDGLWPTALFINVIGSHRNHERRADILARTGLLAEQFATLIHPGAAVSARARIGRGCCINFGASVSGAATIGDQVWVGPGCIVGHDSMLEPYALMAPRATISGFVRLGASCYIGTCAVIRQNVRIGERALVGMGAVVLEDVAPDSVMIGNPAREINRRERA